MSSSSSSDRSCKSSSAIREDLVLATRSSEVPPFLGVRDTVGLCGRVSSDNTGDVGVLCVVPGPFVRKGLVPVAELKSSSPDSDENDIAFQQLSVLFTLERRQWHYNLCDAPDERRGEESDLLLENRL